MGDVDCIVDKSLRLAFLETFFIQNGGDDVKKEIDLMIYDGEDIRDDPIDKGIRKELLDTLVKIYNDKKENNNNNNEEEKKENNINVRGNKKKKKKKKNNNNKKKKKNKKKNNNNNNNNNNKKNDEKEEEKKMDEIKKELDELIYDGTDLKSQYNYDEDYKAVFPCKTLGLK